jgi:hypothetical protein
LAVAMAARQKLRVGRAATTRQAPCQL